MTKTVGLFDLDGTLVDSETMRDRAHDETIRHFGGKGLPEGFVREIGKGKVLVAQDLIARAGIAVSVAEYIAFYERAVVAHSKEVLLAPGALALLEALKARGVRLALVTSAAKSGMDALLATAGIRSYFEICLSGDDVLRLKPDPEPYLLAMEKMHASPEDCFILEDSLPGISAGVASRIKTFAIRRRHNANLDLTIADVILEETESTEVLVGKLLE